MEWQRLQRRNFWHSLTYLKRIHVETGIQQNNKGSQHLAYEGMHVASKYIGNTYLVIFQNKRHVDKGPLHYNNRNADNNNETKDTEQ